MDVIGRLRNAYKINDTNIDLRAPCISGEIFGDVRKRFTDGDRVITSRVVLEDDGPEGHCVYTESGSSYIVENWIEPPDYDVPEPVAPAGETSAQAFKRLGSARISAAIKRIQLVGNLSNRSTYEYTDAQVDKMFAAMQAELDAARKKFAPKVKDAPAFTFDD